MHQVKTSYFSVLDKGEYKGSESWAISVHCLGISERFYVTSLECNGDSGKLG
jgi:hypothetical protein